MPEVILNSFYGGISDDVRDQSPSVFAFSEQFDVITNPYRITPNISLIADEDKTFLIRDFFLGSNAVFYGLGRDTGDTKNTLYYKASNAITGAWTAVTGGQSTVKARKPGTFIEFNGAFYGFQGTTDVWRFVVATATFTNTALSVGAAITTNAQGLICTFNNTLYLPYNNRLVSVDSSGALTDDVFEVPSYYTITSLANWGNYLAIAVVDKTIPSTANSKIFLWNTIDSTAQEIVDCGEEALGCIGNVGTVLRMVSIGQDVSPFNDTLVIKEWSYGQSATTIKAIPLPSQGYSILPQKFTEENKLFFCLSINNNGEVYKGIWVSGAKNHNYPTATTQIIKPNNDSSVTTIEGFYRLGSYWWIAYNGDGSVNRTDDGLSYSATSLLNTQIFNGGNLSRLKKLLGVSVGVASLPSSSSLTIKYKADSDVSFTTLDTINSFGAIANQVNRITYNTAFPRFYEIQFQIDSQGGAEMTELRFQFEYMGDPTD